MNQTWYGLFPVYIKSTTKRVFAIACLEKKLVSHREFCYYFKKVILKNGLFDWVIELFKLNQTWYRIFPVYIESTTKKVFAIACLEKKLVSHREFCYYFK